MKRLPILALLATVTLAMVLLSFIRDRESITREALVAEWQREGGAHQFVPLSEGVTHYELTGPEDGPSIILIHGASGPMGVWDATAPALATAGFRVLRFDLYGRGLSDRPPLSRYALDTYARQTTELAERVGLRWPVHLVGSSMGAMVSTEIARAAPDKVRALSFVGPAGFPLQVSPLARLMNIQGVGEYLMKSAGDSSLSEHHRRYFFRPERFTALQGRFERQLQVKGSKQAILATFRNVPLQDYLEGYAALGGLQKPVQIIWGREDRAFPYEHHTKLLALLGQGAPTPEFIGIEATGHLPQVEAADTVTAALVAFCRAAAPPSQPGP
jgi:pimeloyl-ACP methyl ester carboxylesterase